MTPGWWQWSSYRPDEVLERGRPCLALMGMLKGQSHQKRLRYDQNHAKKTVENMSSTFYCIKIAESIEIENKLQVNQSGNYAILNYLCHENGFMLQMI